MTKQQPHNTTQHNSNRRPSRNQRVNNTTTTTTTTTTTKTSVVKKSGVLKQNGARRLQLIERWGTARTIRNNLHQLLFLTRYTSSLLRRLWLRPATICFYLPQLHNPQSSTAIAFRFESQYTVQRARKVTIFASSPGNIFFFSHVASSYTPALPFSAHRSCKTRILTTTTVPAAKCTRRTNNNKLKLFIAPTTHWNSVVRFFPALLSAFSPVAP